RPGERRGHPPPAGHRGRVRPLPRTHPRGRRHRLLAARPQRPVRRAHRRRARGAAPRGRRRRRLRHVPRRRGHPDHDAAGPSGDRDQRRAARRSAGRHLRGSRPRAGARRARRRARGLRHHARHHRRTRRRTHQGGPMIRRLDRKLDAILAGRYTPDDFIIADAKDADMAFGVAAPWRGRSRSAYLDNMRELVAADALDILLTSASNGERLAADGSLDEEVTLAVRANDTTDIWNHRGSGYTAAPSRPFRTAELAAVRPFCDLVLYSVTFNNDVDRDLATLEAYRAFRRG